MTEGLITAAIALVILGCGFIIGLAIAKYPLVAAALLAFAFLHFFYREVLR